MTALDTIKLLFAIIIIFIIGLIAGYFYGNKKIPNKKPNEIEKVTVTVVHDTITINNLKYKSILKTDTVKVYDTLMKEYTVPYTVNFDTTITFNNYIDIVDSNYNIFTKEYFQTTQNIRIDYKHPLREIDLFSSIKTDTLQIYPLIIYKCEKKWYDENWVKTTAVLGAFAFGIWVGSR